MQFWPRRKAKRPYSRIRAWPSSKDPKPLGFAGYKVGMTHMVVTDTKHSKKNKIAHVSIPVTVIECPPLKISSVRFYKKHGYGTAVSKEIMLKADKDLGKKLKLPKTANTDVGAVNPDEYTDVRIIVYTQPKFTAIGKKKPEVFELALGGSNAEKLEFVKQHIDKDITISDIFSEGDQLDFVTVTKGKGYQGPVKRFGVGIRPAKSEKTKRGPGSLGGWKGQAHFMYRIAHAGQMGFFNRTEYNKWLLKIGDKPEEINPKGGFVKYGLVKSNYILVKGSVGGSLKRLVRFKKAIRPNKLVPKEAPSIEHISLESKQGI